MCEIYTDVDGVYTSDPRIVPRARKLDRIAYDEMLELASLGAKVLQIRSVEFAKRYQVPVHVRSSFNDNEGTWVVEEDSSMEEVSVAGVAADQNEAKLTVRGVPDQPGRRGAALRTGRGGGHRRRHDHPERQRGRHHRHDVHGAARRLRARRSSWSGASRATIGARDVRGDLDVAKVSIVGVGMRTHAGIAARMFEVLADEGINIQMISTSEIKISVVVDAKYAELAVRALHDAFIPAA